MEYQQALTIAADWEKQNACGHGAQVARALYRNNVETRAALNEADKLIDRIESFYDGADMFAWAKVRAKVRAALKKE